MQKELVQIIDASIDATVSAFFRDDIGIVPGPTTVKETDETQQPTEHVTAIVSFSGEMSGGIHLSAPTHVAFAIASAFSGEKVTDFDDRCQDAIGELVNIVAGSIKERLRPSIYLTPPNVVTGDYHNVGYMDKLESAKCYFQSNVGPFFFEVFYKEAATKIVDELRKDHEEIISAFINLSSVGIQTKEGQEIFHGMEKLYISHLRHIDEQIYPVLRASADEETNSILSGVRRETTRIGEHISDFASKLLSGDHEDDYLKNRLIFIVDLLETSFNLEEEIVFEQYFQVFEEPED